MINTNHILQRNQTNFIRGILILLIAIFHVLLEWDVPRYFNLTGSVCVAGFLFLSGFGIHESYKKNRLDNYWKKRLKRIILPYTLFITILIPFHSFNLKDYLLDITYIHSSYWFIEYLVWNYLVYWIAQRFFSKYLFIVFLLFGLIGLNVFMQMEAEQSFSFVLGVFASYHIEKIRSIDNKKITFFVATSFLFGLFFLLLKEIPAVHAYKGTVTYNYILLMIKLPMAIPLLISTLYIPVLLRSRLLYMCGISSLEIYLVHLAMISLVKTDCFYVLFYIILTIVFTYLFYQFNNRIINRFI